MQSLFVLFSALTVFGLGVTAVDLFGLLDQLSGASHDDDAGGDGHSTEDAGPDSGESGDSADSGSDDAADGDEDSGSADDTSAQVAAHSHHDNALMHHGAQGSYVGSAETGTKIVAKTMGILRLGVYFSLGAGPTGLFGLFTGLNAFSALGWSAGAGIFIALLAKSLRLLMRRDLDSSLKPEEFLMNQGSVSVSILPGSLGKVLVRHAGIEKELYAKAIDPKLKLLKGTIVRIVDYDDDCYTVEPLE